MGIFLANPWGLLALLGIPAVLLIHLLRRKSRQLIVSTLFLVEQALPSSEGGRRIRRLQNSLPLWLQLLAVCALTWLLVQPRWIDVTSTQTVVAVFDDSASMSAFRDQTLQRAADELANYESAAAHTRWVFLRSDASRLSAGETLSDALANVRQDWAPSRGAHDTTEAFRLARTLAGPSGAVVFFTDRVPAPETVEGVHWVASGEPVENTGFLGAAVEDGKWSALLRNFGVAQHNLRWRVAGENGPWQTSALAPGGMSEISGAFPSGKSAIELELEGDRFSFDDRLPILRPQPKFLTISSSADEKYAPLFEQLVQVAQPAQAATGGKGDVVFAVFNPLAPQLPDQAAVVFVSDPAAVRKQAEGLLVAENHPLMQGLNWQGLIAVDTLQVPAREGDIPLLWKGRRPMIFLRPGEKGPTLIFNFDMQSSNAARLPAFVLLVNRFLADLRTRKEAYEAKNAETRQSVAVTGVGTISAPAKPEFFQAKTADGSVIFDGAAQFNDLREADFQAATKDEGNRGKMESVRNKHLRGDFLDPLWAALLGAFMIWNWFLTGAPTTRQMAVK